MIGTEEETWERLLCLFMKLSGWLARGSLTHRCILFLDDPVSRAFILEFWINNRMEKILDINFDLFAMDAKNTFVDSSTFDEVWTC